MRASRRRAIALRVWTFPIAVALVAVGCQLAEQTARPEVAVDPGHPIPKELFGRYVRGADATFESYISLTGPNLAYDQRGAPIMAFGRAVSFTPAAPDSLDGRLVLRSSEGCDEGVYDVVADDGIDIIPAPTSVRFVPVADGCLDRARMLGNGLWSPVSVELMAGGSYGSLDFTEPFHLRVPADLRIINASVGWMHQARSAGQLDISHPWWNGSFIDDMPVNRDLCDASKGTLPDIPPTFEAVEGWLGGSARVSWDRPVDVVVDGRRAVRWRVHDACDDAGIRVTAADGGGDVYAIQAPDDMILFVVRPDTANEAAAIEVLVRAVTFD